MPILFVHDFVLGEIMLNRNKQLKVLSAHTLYLHTTIIHFKAADIKDTGRW